MTTPTSASNDSKWRQRFGKDAPENSGIPGQVHEGETAGAKEMIRIILRRDLMRVPVPDCRRDKRNGSENP